MPRKPLVDDPTYDRLQVHAPEAWAVGLPGIVSVMTNALPNLGPRRTLRLR